MADEKTVTPVVPPAAPAVTTAAATTTPPPTDPNKPTWSALFRSGEDKPIAIFRNDVAYLSADFRAALPDGDQMDVVSLGEHLNVNVPAGAKDHLAFLHDQRTKVSPNPQAGDVLKAEIRNQMTQDRLRAQFTEEVKKEFEEQDKKAKAEGKPVPPPVPAAPAPPTPTSPAAVGVKP